MQAPVRQTQEKRNIQNGENHSEEAEREEDVMYRLHGSGARVRGFEGALVQARGREKGGRALLPQILRCHCLGRD